MDAEEQAQNALEQHDHLNRALIPPAHGPLPHFGGRPHHGLLHVALDHGGVEHPSPVAHVLQLVDLEGHAPP